MRVICFNAAKKGDENLLAVRTPACDAGGRGSSPVAPANSSSRNRI